MHTVISGGQFIGIPAVSDIPAMASPLCGKSISLRCL